MRILRKLIFILLAVITPCSASAIDQVFKILDARQGLTSSQVNCILKDSRGFMWFGTPAGLYRYDGYIYKHFQCDSQDGSSLPDSYIESIQEMDGDLWIKTPADYCIYHPQSESFERDMRMVFSRIGMKEVPSIIYIDRYKNLWGYISGRGVICYNTQQQLHFEFGYTNDANGIPQGTICSISECKDGVILVYEDGRMVCCSVNPQQHVAWKNTDIAQQKLRNTKTLRVFADQMDNLWLYGQGTLFMYNKKAHVWDTHIGDALDLSSITVDHAINAMGGDRSGNIWLGTNRHGLMRINVNTHTMEEVTIRSMSPFRMAKNNMGVRSIYVDDTDLLWVGTAKSGVAYTGQNIYKFEADPIGDITALTQDASGKIWYGTSDNGILDYEGRLASLKVSAMACTNDGSIWVGSVQNGLTRIKDGQATIYSVAMDSTRRTLIDDHVHALAADKMNNLWIATDGGLQVYNPRTNQFSSYTRENGKIRVNNITSLYYAKGNKMLIGTSEGLIILNISTTEMKYLVGNSTSMQKFTNNYVTQVYEDSRGLIWVGTREGVNIYNPDNDMLNYLTEKNGLCNNNICGIAEDKNKNVWISTSNGLCRIVTQRNHEDGTYNFGLYNYTHDDGLQSDEFNLGAMMVKNDGNVFFGGLNGINWVRKKTADETESLPRVMLTQLFIGEEEILTGHAYDGNVPLQQALNESSRIELNSDQNTFTIKFAAGNYNQSERLQFMYMMEGLDKMWHDGDAMKHGVTFTDIPSGTYRLHVKAISAEGAVSDQERVIEIVIMKPWFLQWWMLVVYAIVLIVVVYLWKQGMDELRALWKKKNAILGELARQKEEIKAASDELRQPMSRMTTIIMNLSERETTLEEREQLNTLHSQMLQVITRVSDMQMALENPEEKAKKNVHRFYELNSNGEMSLPEVLNDELTSEIRPYQAELPTVKFRVVFIDSNQEFTQFIYSRLKYIYDFHPYDNIRKAAAEIEATMPDLVICKQDMAEFTGSELCNNIKMHPTLNKIKFVLLTDTKLTGHEMVNQNITMAADDYLAKPFNIQEAVMRFNKLLGVGPIEVNSNLIEGAETRQLEERNSSMTTATESMDLATIDTSVALEEDEQLRMVEVRVVKNHSTDAIDTNYMFGNDHDEMHEKYSMSDTMDQQLLNSIEQYVQQNMNRGTINLEDMAAAMGMSMKPLFQKVKEITGRTPAEVVRDLRLKHACILLQRTNINMSELANHVGFATGEHFINIFKERFGMSPSEYRLKYRK
jgi:ligand-binding sensor domain-containing protein/AraC-like DNA-binding protein/DNA-binding response OmpR family regulator